MTVIIRIGSRGQEVILVQTLLNLAPPTNLPLLQVDGIFGPRTETRVREFQRNKGLAADGVIGPKSFAALIPNNQFSLAREEFDLLVQQLFSTLRSQTRSNPAAIQFFQRHTTALRSSAFSQFGGAAVQTRLVGAPVGQANVQVFGAIPVVVAVGVVVLVAALFTLALLIVMAQNRGANPADIRALELEFDRRIAELNQKLLSAPFEIAAFIILIKITVEQAVKAQVERLKRQIERCNALNPNPDPACLTILRVISETMDHVVQQSLILTLQLQRAPQSALVKAQLIGLARTFGFLMLQITKFGKCMGCDFLIFF